MHDRSEAGQWIREVLPQFESQGVTLGLEDHEKHSCFDLARLVRRLDSRRVRICLDTGDSLGAREPSERVVETPAPLTVNLHLKDFVIERLAYKMGFVVSGAPAGSGINIPWLLREIRSDDNVFRQSGTVASPEKIYRSNHCHGTGMAEQGVPHLRSGGGSKNVQLKGRIRSV